MICKIETIIEIIGGLFVMVAIGAVIAFIVACCVAGALCVVAVAFAVGIVMAIRNLCLSIHSEINLLEWDWANDDEPARRGYCFGPGFLQIKNAAMGTFEQITISASEARVMGDWLYNIGISLDGALGTTLCIAARIFQVSAFISVAVSCAITTTVLSIVAGVIILVLSAIISVVFALVRLVDDAYLTLYKIRADCPIHKGTYKVPAFRCPNPDCNRIHRKLRPNIYGIFHHRCTCKQILPSTCFNGRGSLSAVCPEPSCNAELLTANSRPICLQLVGGTLAGKTVYLSAFHHLFSELLNANSLLDCQISPSFHPFFDTLETYFQCGVTPGSTRERNAQMYPYLIHGEKLTPQRYLYLYDIGGEMFDGSSDIGTLEQKQYRYADGILLIVDPYSEGGLREQRKHQLDGISNIAAYDVVSNFVSYLAKNDMKKLDERYNTPVAVLIVKSDLPEVKGYLDNIHARIDPHNAEALSSAYQGLLNEIGMNQFVSSIERNFSHVRYFALSAMGHEEDGEPYTPWGVLEPVQWLLSQADSVLADQMNESKPSQSEVVS